jgi:branched-chain amino acid transport system ATP-binding protein
MRASSTRIWGPAMLRIDRVSAAYQEAYALREVTLHVAAGEIVTVCGRNGAGKTTLLRTVMGLHEQMTGDVYVGDVNVRRLPAHQRARLGVGWVPDDRGTYAGLTVSEALTISHVRSASSWSVERIYQAFPSLAARARTYANRLSGGEQQMLALARVLHMGSHVVLADEPTEGLSPLLVARVGEVLREIRDAGAAVLLVEQNLHFAAGLADRHYLLAQGRVAAELGRDELVHREQELLTHLGM